MTGATVSHIANKDGSSIVVLTMTIAVLTLASWALRPQSRRLGTISGAPRPTGQRRQPGRQAVRSGRIRDRARCRLRGAPQPLALVAHRMLGSPIEADDAVQEAWLKLMRADTSAVENLRGWLTTVVARVCLDMLRARTARREEPLAAAPEPTVTSRATADRELAESVGLALLVVLDKLDPAERLAFVLHDMFAMSFDEIAPIVGRSTAAARQLASRARRRVQGASAPEVDLAIQRRVVGRVHRRVARRRHGGAGRRARSRRRRARRRRSRPGSRRTRVGPWRGRVPARGRAHATGSGRRPRRPRARARRQCRARAAVGFAGATIRDVEVVTEPDTLAELVIEDLP